VQLFRSEGDQIFGEKKKKEVSPLSHCHS